MYFQFNTPQWEPISDTAKDLVQRMLAVDQNRRITIHEILSHKWVRERDKGSRGHLIDTVEEMKKLNARRKSVPESFPSSFLFSERAFLVQLAE